MVAVTADLVVKNAVDRQTTTIEHQTVVLEQLLEEQRNTNRWLAHLSTQQGGRR